MARPGRDCRSVAAAATSWPLPLRFGRDGERQSRRRLARRPRRLVVRGRSHRLRRCTRFCFSSVGRSALARMWLTPARASAAKDSRAPQRPGYRFALEGLVRPHVGRRWMRSPTRRARS